jgi:hypothetical protein
LSLPENTNSSDGNVCAVPNTKTLSLVVVNDPFDKPTKRKRELDELDTTSKIIAVDSSSTFTMPNMPKLQPPQVSKRPVTRSSNGKNPLAVLSYFHSNTSKFKQTTAPTTITKPPTKPAVILPVKQTIKPKQDPSKPIHRNNTKQITNNTKQDNVEQIQVLEGEGENEFDFEKIFRNGSKRPAWDYKGRCRIN